MKYIFGIHKYDRDMILWTQKWILGCLILFYFELTNLEEYPLFTANINVVCVSCETKTGLVNFLVLNYVFSNLNILLKNVFVENI